MPRAPYARRSALHRKQQNEASSALDSTFALIEPVRRGDREALERLLTRHVDPLRRWVSGRLPRWARDLADTDDLFQDNLLRTFKKIEDFEAPGVGALHAYLRQAVLNRVRDELRRKARSPLQVDDDGLDLEAEGSPLEEAIGRDGRNDDWFLPLASGSGALSCRANEAP